MKSVHQNRSSSSINRRRFISGCACCMGCAAGSRLLSPEVVRGELVTGGKAKVRLIFCETTNDKPIWPNIGYDFDTRRKKVIETITGGCPDIDFAPVRVLEGSAQETVEAALANPEGVDGFIVCLQGLGWRNDVVKLCATGKPTLLVDNLFGGSGLFLGKISPIMKSGGPVDWVSSSNDADIVESARQFAQCRKGKTPAEVAALFRSTRRGRTPSESNWTCQPDAVASCNFDQALAKIRQTKLLVVGGGRGGDAFRKAAFDATGVTFVPISFPEMAEAYEQASAGEGVEFADRWIQGAQQVVEPDRAEIETSGRMYVAMKRLIEKYGASGISVNCLGGFYGGHLKAYPCLGFSQLNNDGLVGGCEADQMSALTMSVIGSLTGRPGYISDPVIDTAKNRIVYAHCVGMTKAFGPQGPSNPYRLRTHSEDRKGVAVQSLLPEGYLTTTLEINPATREILFHQAKSAGNNPSDLACRTKLEATVKGSLEKLTENWGWGWHRVTFYGNLEPQVAELCDRLKLRLVREV